MEKCHTDKRLSRLKLAKWELLEQCSTKHAPWYVVPADHKWFRNWVISDALVRILKGLQMDFPRPEKGIENVKVV